MLELIGTDHFIEVDDVIKLIFRLVLDVGFTFVLVKFVYSRDNNGEGFTFSFFLLNVITFSICILLRKVPVDMGFALGLFAVFGILRYRTEPMHIRDLTYLFVVIGLAIINAVANRRVSLVELLFVDTLIVVIAAVLDTRRSVRNQRSKPLKYDNLSLLAPEKREELLVDLRERTGLPISSVEIERIDLLRDSANLTVVYEHRNTRPA